MLAVIGALCLWFAWTIRAVLNPLVLGYLLAYVLHPLVQKIERHGRSRRAAVNLVFIGGFVLFLVVTGGFLAESNRLRRDVASNEVVREEIGSRLTVAREKLEAYLPEEVDLSTPAEVFAWVREALFEDQDRAQAAGRAGLRAAGGALHVVQRVFGSIAELLGLLLLLPIYTYFLLFELDRIHTFVRRYLPVRDRERLSGIGHKIGEMLANFLRGRLLVCLLKGAILTGGLLVLGVDYAFLFGMGSGFLSLVPVVGPLVGWLCAFLVGILEHDVVGSLWRTGLVFWGAEMIEGYVLVPKVLGDSLGLHPIVVLFAVIAGGAALGLFGILIALPLTAALVILVRELVLPALARLVDEEPEPSG